MKTMIKVILVMSLMWLGIFACTKHTETSGTMAQDMKASNQGTPYLQASASFTQEIVTNPQMVLIDNNDGFNKVNLNGGSIEFEFAGEYLLIAAPQVGRLGETEGLANFRCWLVVNGTPVTNSNVLLNLRPWTKDVIICQGIVSLNAGDLVTIMIATNNLEKGVAIEALSQDGEEPLVPAIIFTAYKIN